MVTLYDSLIRTLLEGWKMVFKKHPKSTLIVTLCIFAGIITLSIFMGIEQEKIRENQRLKNQNYKTQIQQLEQTEDNLKGLIEFIEEQKLKLKKSQKNLEFLKNEYDKLHPIVSTDRKLIDKIFEILDERSRSNIWKERLIGFVSGLVASLIAALIWYLVVNFIRKRSYEKGEIEPGG